MTFTVLHEPLPTPRARVSTYGGFARAYTPAKVRGRSYKAYQEAIKLAAAGCKRISGAVTLDAEFVLRPPMSLMTAAGTLRKSARAHPIGSRDGDPDNYAKGLMDALKGIAWADDCQVVDLRVTKRWAKPGEPGQVIVHKLEALEAR